MPAPGAALVFLSQDSLNAVSPPGQSTISYPTTTQTGRHAGRPTIDAQLLLTMNGRGGKAGPNGKSSSRHGVRNSAVMNTGTVAGVVFGALGAWAVMTAQAIVA